MKILKICLFIIIISTLLCTYSSNVYGKPKTPAPIEQPTLVDIEQIYVDVLRTDFGPEQNSFIWRELEEKVEKKLKDVGIKTAPAIYVGAKSKVFNIPELRFSINTLKLTDSNECVFHIQMSLARKAYLNKKPQGYLKAGVWKTKPIMQSTALAQVDDKITKSVLIEVEKFIQAYLTANPKDASTADANLVVPLKKKVETTTSKPIKYQYLASKNSKVFHQPKCSSAQRIKSQNRIIYKNREEAIGSGKRPCKLCKP
ncbi:MAG: Ada metal-binding domain-containing protein [Planctomycetota bacterium]|jgi:hypothetical protein